MRCRVPALLFFTFVSNCLLAPSPEAAILSVPDSFPTIQSALDFAATGDVVLVAPGTYGGPGNRDLDLRGKGLVLRSLPGAEATVLDCGGSAAEPHRGFLFHSGEGPDALVIGFTVRNGHAPGDGPGRLRVGGAVSLVASSPCFVDCVFEECAATRGGAIYAVNSAARFLRCTARTNAAEAEGGGVYCRGAAAPSFARCAIIGNSAASGGGVFCDSGAPEFSRCLIAGNQSAEGGGAYCIIASPEFTNCTFDGNAAGAGSGLLAYFHSHPTLDRSIVAFGATGEGLRCGSSSSIAVTCSDVFGNDAGDWVGCVAGQAERDGNFSTDPRFCGAAGAGWPETACHLQQGSACLRAPGCGLVGAYGQGCVRHRAAALDRSISRAPWLSAGSDAVPSSWGALKHRYDAP